MTTGMDRGDVVMSDGPKSAPAWLAPYLRESPPSLEVIEAHRARLGHTSSRWWLYRDGWPPVCVWFSVVGVESFIRETPPGPAPWLRGEWPSEMGTMMYGYLSHSAEELRAADGRGLARWYIAPCDTHGNMMEWP